MSTFKIVQCDPVQYKEQILQFWKDYLPGTPPDRLEWMKNNPAGPTIWFLAFKENSNEIAGTISIMPKELFMDNQKIRVGILGDYMVAKKYRLYGPALQLQKHVVQKVKYLGFKFIYTIPNPESIKVLERAGFEKNAKLYYFVKPIQLTYYLSKFINPASAKLIAPFAGAVLKLFSKETYIPAIGFFEEVTEIDDLFDKLWHKMKMNKDSTIIGGHDSAYLRWKYFKNPLKKFRILAYKNDPNAEMSGYIVFSIDNNKMEIHDALTLDSNCADKLLKKMVKIAEKESCQSIYFTLSGTNPWRMKLKPYLFLDTKSDVNIYFIGEKNFLNKDWIFFEGDRNV